jgi:hypothetical protein
MSRGANTVVVNKKKNREIGIKQVLARVTLLGGVVTLLKAILS